MKRNFHFTILLLTVSIVVGRPGGEIENDARLLNGISSDFLADNFEGSALDRLSDGSEKVKEMFDAGSKNIDPGQTFKDVIGDDMSENAIKDNNPFPTDMESIGENLKQSETLENAIKEIPNEFRDKAEDFQEGIKDRLDDIRENFSNSIPEFPDDQNTIQKIKDTMDINESGHNSPFSMDINNVGEDLKPDEAMEDVINKIKEIPTGFRTKVEDFQEGVKDKFGDIQENIGDSIPESKPDDAMGDVVNKIQEIPAGFRNKAEDFQKDVKEKFGDIRENFGDSVPELPTDQNPIEKMKDMAKIDDLKDNLPFPTDIEDFRDEFKTGGALENVFNGLKEIPAEFHNKVKNYHEDVKDRVGEIRDNFREVPKKVWKHVEEVPKKIIAMPQRFSKFLRKSSSTETPASEEKGSRRRGGMFGFL